MSRDSTPGFSAGASAPGGAPTLNDHGHRPADNNRVLPGGGRRSFANPSPAEIVVRNRQISLTPRSANQTRENQVQSGARRHRKPGIVGNVGIVESVTYKF